MIEDQLRAHYQSISVDPDTAARLLDAVENSAQRPSLRTGLAVSGSVAAVGVVALTIALLPRHDGAPAAAGSTASPNPSSSVTAVVSTVPPTPSATSTTVSVEPVTPQVVVATLTELLSPSGTSSSPGGRGLDNQSLGNVVFNDGHGASRIDIAVTWKATAPHDAVPQGCSPSPTCTVLPDGTSVEASQGLEYGSGSTQPINATEWSVSAYRPSAGLQIDISEWNAPAEKDSPLTRVAPPFTIAQLTTLATSTLWSATASSSQIAAAQGLFVPDFMPNSEPTDLSSGSAGSTSTATH